MNAAEMEEYHNAAFKDYNEKVLDPCPNCGRTFLSDRLTIHMRSCKAPSGGGAAAASGPGRRNAGGGLGGASPPQLKGGKLT